MAPGGRCGNRLQVHLRQHDGTWRHCNLRGCRTCHPFRTVATCRSPPLGSGAVTTCQIDRDPHIGYRVVSHVLRLTRSHVPHKTHPHKTHSGVGQLYGMAPFGTMWGGCLLGALVVGARTGGITTPDRGRRRQGALGGTCHTTIDSADPVKGPVRAGDDYSCAPVATPTKNTVDGCAALCCGDSRCKSFSFNAPWALNVSYMECVNGVNCCCLKSAVAPLEPNSW
jgi:hypothetical protein